MPCVRNVLVSVPKERVGVSSFNYESLTLKFRLENEFDLIFVVGFLPLLHTLAYMHIVYRWHINV